MVANLRSPRPSPTRRPGNYEEYHPYGTTAWWAGNAATVSQKRYRYTGMERDEETGLQCHGVRYYAPWLARWISSDPLGLVDGLNPYAYVRGSPSGGRDQSGTVTLPVLHLLASSSEDWVVPFEAQAGPASLPLDAPRNQVVENGLAQWRALKMSAQPSVRAEVYESVGGLPAGALAGIHLTPRAPREVTIPRDAARVSFRDVESGRLRGSEAFKAALASAEATGKAQSFTAVLSLGPGSTQFPVAFGKFDLVFSGTVVVGDDGIATATGEWQLSDTFDFDWTMDKLIAGSTREVLTFGLSGYFFGGSDFTLKSEPVPFTWNSDTNVLDMNVVTLPAELK